MAQINNTITSPSTRGLISPQTPPPVMGGTMPSATPSVSTSPLGALGSAVKSHTITISPDGTQKHTVVHDNGEKQAVSGLVNPKAPSKQAEPLPPIHFINGKHYVPFKMANGKMAHINAEGHIIT